MEAALDMLPITLIAVLAIWQAFRANRVRRECVALRAELTRRERDIEAMNMAAFRRGRSESLAEVIRDLQERLTMKQTDVPERDMVWRVSQARRVSPAEAKEIAHGILEKAEARRDETARAEAARDINT